MRPAARRPLADRLRGCGHRGHLSRGYDPRRSRFAGYPKSPVQSRSGCHADLAIAAWDLHLIGYPNSISGGARSTIDHLAGRLPWIRRDSNRSLHLATDQPCSLPSGTTPPTQIAVACGYRRWHSPIFALPPGTPEPGDRRFAVTVRHSASHRMHAMFPSDERRLAAIRAFRNKIERPILAVVPQMPCERETSRSRRPTVDARPARRAITCGTVPSECCRRRTHAASLSTLNLAVARDIPRHKTRSSVCRSSGNDEAGKRGRPPGRVVELYAGSGQRLFHAICGSHGPASYRWHRVVRDPMMNLDHIDSGM